MSSLAMCMLDVFPGDGYDHPDGSRWYVERVCAAGLVTLRQFAGLYAEPVQRLLGAEELGEHYSRTEVNWAARISRGCAARTDGGGRDEPQPRLGGPRHG